MSKFHKHPRSLTIFFSDLSFAKYLKAKATNTLNKYKHRPAVAEDAKKLLKPIYEDLTKTELLERCLGDHPQNNW